MHTILARTKKNSIVAAAFSVAFTITAPYYAFAAGLVPCGGSGEQACNFNYFIQLIGAVIHFLVFYLAVPLAAISFAIAGVMILTAGGNEGQVAKAKEIFWNVLIGLVVALAAWLVVNAIIVALGAGATSLLTQQP
jgi:hypothetical protein